MNKTAPEGAMWVWPSNLGNSGYYRADADGQCYVWGDHPRHWMAMPREQYTPDYFEKDDRFQRIGAPLAPKPAPKADRTPDSDRKRATSEPVDWLQEFPTLPQVTPRNPLLRNLLIVHNPDARRFPQI